jgi:transcription termination/antitermination protein NusG
LLACRASLSARFILTNIHWVTKKRDLEGEAMASNSLAWQTSNSIPLPVVQLESWYALHTRPRHEKAVVQRLTDRGVETFLPIITEVHRWSDRKKKIEMPLFGCYVFARFVPNRADRLRILRVDGVLGLVGSQSEGTAIPDDQIDAVRTLVDGALSWSPYPFLKIGQRVRIRGGALEGMEGILVSRNGKHTLVISVDAIQRSLAVHVEGYQVEAA